MEIEPQNPFVKRIDNLLEKNNEQQGENNGRQKRPNSETTNEKTP